MNGMVHFEGKKCSAQSVESILFLSFFPFDAVSSLVLSLLTINSSLEFIGYMIGIT